MKRFAIGLAIVAAALLFIIIATCGARPALPDPKPGPVCVQVFKGGEFQGKRVIQVPGTGRAFVERVRATAWQIGYDLGDGGIVKASRDMTYQGRRFRALGANDGESMNCKLGTEVQGPTPGGGSLGCAGAPLDCVQCDVIDGPVPPPTGFRPGEKAGQRRPEPA
jgi:hypothetical protein